MRFTLPSAMPAAAFVLLASCVGAPQQRAPVPAPAPRPAPAAQPAPPPPPPADWQDRATTAGDWRYQVDGAGSAALFGPDAQGSLFVIRCDRTTRRVSLLRPGPAQAAMTVRTSYGAVNWPAGPATGAIAATQATRAASDATLDQIAYSRGRFAVEVQGLEMLVLPSWAEVGRVVEDCRA
ncbi:MULTISPECIES: hypothetical protein [Sphingobium]|uniref:Lipoprotein n=1 Tax=Sphingobium fuliginis (strain ATCC 27551) TaxID=336203 RepID=A0ABQ1F9P0_SPHSA|nr:MULTISPECIES: hypothetical protein [Sphingobium]AJR24159.1 hypothetical protein TZ53_10875 [Sphingobium sp. YBL2]RYL99890.1 hypothetical protein EWH10_08580 [Sphingobium fuliginis]WDA36275.1 hypothetical protein PO876_23050 [Sphingobium sp. YC-XJ3]GGA03125.1 hypothetical protein GCM10019071_37200 [Sphingobium fuliginis]